LSKKLTANPVAATALEKWTAIRMSINSAASETIGVAKKKRRTPECPIIDQLSKQQHELRIKIKNTFNTDSRQRLKRQRKELLDQIRNQANINENNEIDRRTAEINQLKDGAGMFQAVKELTSNKKKTLVIKNDAD
jgi:hypothetical protein